MKWEVGTGVGLGISNCCRSYLFFFQVINKYYLILTTNNKSLDHIVEMGSWSGPSLSARARHITKTYNVDPLKPHFYIVKLGFTGVNIIFLVSAQNHRLLVFVRTASPSTHNLCFKQKYEKYQNFYRKIFIFWVVKFSVYLNRHVFVMCFLSCGCGSYIYVFFFVFFFFVIFQFLSSSV